MEIEVELREFTSEFHTGRKLVLRLTISSLIFGYFKISSESALLGIRVENFNQREVHFIIVIVSSLVFFDWFLRLVSESSLLTSNMRNLGEVWSQGVNRISSIIGTIDSIKKVYSGDLTPQQKSMIEKAISNIENSVPEVIDQFKQLHRRTVGALSAVTARMIFFDVLLPIGLYTFCVVQFFVWK